MNVQTPFNQSLIVAGNNIGMAALITLVVIIGILAIYFQTTWSMITVWNRSETYAHGFLILPFCIYMIWGRRKHLIVLPHRPNPLALLILVGMGFIWFAATIASVQVLAQYMLVAMIPTVVCAMLGNRILMATAFPLTYLLFAVPFGDVLIPPLINFTADFTVSALQLSGVPVYREGAFFSLPSGNWSVVAACSGLNYLIASVTLGTFYAYLTFRSFKYRLAFITLSIVVPILTNGIRAYLIVMTGHLSDMRLGTGTDHITFGWILFGFVILLLFWIGSFWREDVDKEIVNTSTQLESEKIANNGSSLKATLLMASIVLVIAFIWPISASHLDNKTKLDISPEIKITGTSGHWSINTYPTFDWEPIYIGAPVKFYKHYQRDDEAISLYITYYHNQQQGEELINSGNSLVTENDTHWRIMNEITRSVIIDTQKITVRQTQLHSRSKKLLVWRWYWLGNEETTNPFFAKAYLAKNKLLSSSDEGAEIIIASPYKDNPDEAIPALQQFLHDMKPLIQEGLRNARN